MRGTSTNDDTDFRLEDLHQEVLRVRLHGLADESVLDEANILSRILDEHYGQFRRRRDALRELFRNAIGELGTGSVQEAADAHWGLTKTYGQTATVRSRAAAKAFYENAESAIEKRDRENVARLLTDEIAAIARYGTPTARGAATSRASTFSGWRALRKTDADFEDFLGPEPQASDIFITSARFARSLRTDPDLFERLLSQGVRVSVLIPAVEVALLPYDEGGPLAAGAEHKRGSYHLALLIIKALLAHGLRARFLAFRPVATVYLIDPGLPSGRGRVVPFAPRGHALPRLTIDLHHQDEPDRLADLAARYYRGEELEAADSAIKNLTSRSLWSIAGGKDKDGIPANRDATVADFEAAIERMETYERTPVDQPTTESTGAGD